MAAVIVKSPGAAAQDRDIAFKALQECGKSINFTTGTIEVLVIPQFFRRFFFVVIMYTFLMRTKVTDSAEGFRRFSSTRVLPKCRLTEAVFQLL